MKESKDETLKKLFESQDESLTGTKEGDGIWMKTGSRLKKGGSSVPSLPQTTSRHPKRWPLFRNIIFLRKKIKTLFWFKMGWKIATGLYCFFTDWKRLWRRLTQNIKGRHIKVSYYNWIFKLSVRYLILYEVLLSESRRELRIYIVNY